MPRPRRGEVWLVRCPLSALTSTKLRPARAWAVPGEDIVVLGIFSRVPTNLRTTWVQRDDSGPAFARTGLKKTAVLKAEKLAVVQESVFQRRLGLLPPELMHRVAQALCRALLLGL